MRKKSPQPWTRASPPTSCHRHHEGDGKNGLTGTSLGLKTPWGAFGKHFRSPKSLRRHGYQHKIPFLIKFCKFDFTQKKKKKNPSKIQGGEGGKATVKVPQSWDCVPRVCTPCPCDSGFPGHTQSPSFPCHFALGQGLQACSS